MWLLFAPYAALAEAPAPEDPLILGRELFTRVWEPHDPRTQGDGLGPMFNDSSCVACHSLGGVGGAGGASHNVRIGRTDPDAGFEVLHRASTFGPVPSRGQVSERNSPALFGAGLIDSIPEQAIRQAAAAQASFDGPISGRVATVDGRVARFGWRAHATSLADFVAAACAVELGLEVPGRAQGEPPPEEILPIAARIGETIRGVVRRIGASEEIPYDLTQGELDALTAFVASLPPPIARTDQPSYAAGKESFERIGCSGCHLPVLGPVDGIYSDLLLHDVGISDRASSYSVRTREAPVVAVDTSDTIATEEEWRTPPLWGVRDSGPYLHDGRAPTLDAAIRAHGGEAQTVKNAYVSLSLLEQFQIIAFLESLVAPEGA